MQFTPDMLPSDVTGTMTLRGGELVFRPGPVFTNVLLADEINRTPPKTQAALLEAMQERQVTVDGEPHPLPDPFLVVATQNPIEYEGTYPLPEAQLDRFLFKVAIGYPDEADERAMLALAPPRRRAGDARRRPAGVDAERAAQAAARRSTRPRVADEVARLRGRRSSARTRELPSVELGASPRAAVHLLAAAKARGAARRPRLRHARRRRRGCAAPSSATGSCCGPRPSSSATRPDDADPARRSQAVPVPR